MPLDVARAAIEEAFSDSAYSEVEIDFFGGEPFAAFNDVKELSEWVWNRKWPKPYIIFATTNGTMVHGKIRDWVYKNRNRFILGISFDGTPEMHDLNRNCSSGKIDLDFFSSSWPFQTAKMTVSRLTVSGLAEGVMYLHNRGFKVSCNNAYGMSWEDQDYNIFAQQLRKLADFYVENPNIEPSSVIAMPIQNIAFNTRPSKWCGAGTSMTCIDRLGTRYPCHTFMPSAVGSSMKLDDVFRLLASDDLLDSKCESCTLASCCPTCYGINYIETSDVTYRNSSYCIFSKIRAKATAYMLSLMLTHREREYCYLNDRSEVNLQQMIYGIEHVNQFVRL
jgi:uncharacterized protein